MPESLGSILLPTVQPPAAKSPTREHERYISSSDANRQLIFYLSLCINTHKCKGPWLSFHTLTMNGFENKVAPASKKQGKEL